MTIYTASRDRFVRKPCTPCYFGQSTQFRGCTPQKWNAVGQSREGRRENSRFLWRRTPGLKWLFGVRLTRDDYDTTEVRERSGKDKGIKEGISRIPRYARRVSAKERERAYRKREFIFGWRWKRCFGSTDRIERYATRDVFLAIGVRPSNSTSFAIGFK